MFPFTLNKEVYQTMNERLKAEICEYVDAAIERRLDSICNQKTPELEKLFEQLTQHAFAEWSKRFLTMFEDANERR